MFKFSSDIWKMQVTFPQKVSFFTVEKIGHFLIPIRTDFFLEKLN